MFLPDKTHFSRVEGRREKTGQIEREGAFLALPASASRPFISVYMSNLMDLIVNN